MNDKIETFPNHPYQIYFCDANGPHWKTPRNRGQPRARMSWKMRLIPLVLFCPLWPVLLFRQSRAGAYYRTIPYGRYDPGTEMALDYSPTRTS